MRSLVLLLLASCLPSIDIDESLIDRDRLLAVRADPAEASPGERVAFTALVVGPSGTIGDASLDWSYCTARRPLAELGPVSRDCLFDLDALVFLGVGPDAEGELPEDGCRLFGPEVPPPEPDQPPGRSVGPDLTGGYYQPLRVLGPGETDTTLFETRIACGVAGATPAIAREYRMRYADNRHPGIDRVDVPAPVARDRRVSISIVYAEPEVYVVYDPQAESLLERREAIRVAWYANSGSFANERTGRASSDPNTFSENEWTAPGDAGVVTLWIVVRDDRGGVSWVETSVEVE